MSHVITSVFSYFLHGDCQGWKQAHAKYIKKKNYFHCKKYFQDLLSQHIFFCQINFLIIYLVEITYYFEFLMVKLIYFIVLTQFFQFNQLKILRQPRLLTF